MPEHLKNLRTPRLVWTAIFVLTTYLMLAVGHLHYTHEVWNVEQEKADNLTTIGMLKAGHFAHWRRERLADAIRYAQGPAFFIPALAFLNQPDHGEHREKTLHMLRLNRKGSFYENTLLVSLDNEILLSAVVAHEPLAPASIRAVRQAVATRAPALSGIYRCAGGHTHIDTAAPVCDPDGVPRAAYILSASADDFLYPLIHYWPTDSDTAETLLVTRDNDSVLFVNEVRHRPGSALNLRLPLTQTDLPAVQAVLGHQGLVSGVDYRGNPVLADVRPIPESDWFLVTKIDRQEIIGEVRERTAGIILFVTLGVLLAAALTATGYRRRQTGLYRHLYRVEKEQRATGERFRTILYSIGDGVIVTDAQARVRQMNPVAEHLTGWSEAEARDRPLDEVFRIINEDTRLPVENPVWRVLRDGKIVGLANHTLLIARDGVERPIADSGAPVRDERSLMDGVVLVFRDQSTEHAAQSALRENERRLSTLFHNLPGMAYRCACDDDWSMQFVSEGCRNLLGCDPADLVGNSRFSYASLIHPDDRDFVSDTVSRGVLNHQAFILEYRIHTAAGIEKWVWERGCAVFRADGAVEALEGFICDITERKHAAEEQTRLEEQLQQSQRIEAVGRLAGGVAHDFNNMLAVIISSAEQTLDQLGPGHTLHGNLREIIGAGKRSAEMVRQLLAFASQQPITPRVLNLNQTVAGMTTMLGRLLGEGIGLEWRPGAGLWNVRMDPGQIDQMLVNLAVNARDAIDGVGQVCIETCNVGAEALRDRLPPDLPAANYVLLSVSDDGCGMSAETLEHIFEPFFTTKAKGLGTGLGLSTIYGIVKQNRGFIRVTSELGKGSRFSLFLPSCDEPANPPEPDEEAELPGGPPVGPAAKATLLLVEDEPALLNLTATLLRRAGYHVLAANGSIEALELARSHDGVIDLLMTDVVMPEMSGRDLWLLLLQQRPGISCVFMSGYTADIIAHHGVLQGDFHFLQKPFTKERLLGLLQKLLSGPRTAAGEHPPAGTSVASNHTPNTENTP